MLPVLIKVNVNDAQIPTESVTKPTSSKAPCNNQTAVLHETTTTKQM